MTAVPRGIAGALLLISVLAGQGDAQAVRARAIDEESKAPVAGALLSLLEEGGRRVAQSLTDDGGRVLLRAPAAGSYRIRADRIGYEGVTFGPFAVTSDTLAVTVAMPSRRVMLPDLAVSSKPLVCNLDEESGTQMAALWSDARKALTSAELTRTVRPPLLEITKFERDLDRRGRIKAESSSVHQQMGGSTFVSPDPARLIAKGFVEKRGNETWYSGPDANLLLSNEFLEVHCFKVVQGTGADTSRIGLGFEPAKGRKVPEIVGTLWLDRATAELRFVEFGYTNVEHRQVTGKEGGRIEFARLPTGGWIVSDWTIRMPLVATFQRSTGFAGQYAARDSLVGTRETGGRAVVVDRTSAARNRSIVEGVVFDSIRGSPLESVVVSIAGGAYVDTTDEAGRYRIETPTQGEFLVVFDHPRFAALGLAPKTGSASLARGSVATANAAIPPLATIRSTICTGVIVDRDVETVLVGTVRDTLGQPLPRAVLELSWIRDRTLSGSAGAAVIAERGSRAAITTDERGGYRICGVPEDVRIAVHGPDGFVAMPAATRVAEHELTTFDVTLMPTDRVAPTSAARVIVRAIATSRPVKGALVSIRPAGRAEGNDPRILETRTDEGGTALLGPIRPGRYRIDVLALGHDSTKQEVRVGDRDTVDVPVGVSTVAQTLASIEVTGAVKRVHPMLAGFEERRKTGLGHYAAREQLAVREHSALSDVLRMFPGARLVNRPSPCTGHAVASGRESSEARIFRCGAREFPRACFLALYVDGMKIWDYFSSEPPPDIDQYNVHSLEAVEVYVGAAQLPAQFHGSGGSCGAVLLWNRVSG